MNALDCVIQFFVCAAGVIVAEVMVYALGDSLERFLGRFKRKSHL